MIVQAAGERIKGRILENGCGVGMSVERLAAFGGEVVGMEYDFERSAEAHQRSVHILSAAGEHLPFPANSFDLILSHRTTLIFCNSRPLTERVAAKQNMLAEARGGGPRIGAHHGSMSRVLRLEMEEGL